MGVKDIKVEIDFRSGIPIYIQIMDQIRMLIISGDLQQGDQLPTVRQLATFLGINLNTVSRSYKLLDEAGLISTQQGRGTYIWEAPAETMTEQLRQLALQGLTRQYLAKANHLGCSPEDVERAFVPQLALWKSGNLQDK